MKIIKIDESSSESSATMKKVPEKDGIEGLVQEMKLFRQSVDESMQQLQIKMEKFGLMVETSLTKASLPSAVQEDIKSLKTFAQFLVNSSKKANDKSASSKLAIG
jgi:hypothetical protein